MNFANPDRIICLSLSLSLVKAVEYFAEYVLSPNNMAFLRVQTGVCDPAVLGDKAKWFADQLDAQSFSVWNLCNLDLLRRLLQPQSVAAANDTSDSDSESEPEYGSLEDPNRYAGGSSSSSYSSLSDLVNEQAPAAKSQQMGMFSWIQFFISQLKVNRLIMKFINQKKKKKPFICKVWQHANNS